MKTRKVELITIILIAFGYVFSVLIFSGSLFAGYGLVDDHEIIRRVALYQSSEISLYDKILGGFPWISFRFRPLYNLLRQLRCVIFGDNFLLWSIWVGLEIVATIILAYFVARLFLCNHLMSFFFAIIIVTGQQSEIWWRLGPQEPTGILLLMSTILLLQIYEINGKKWWLILGIMCIILTSWTKESFTLVVPFIPLIVIAFDIFSNYEHANLKKKYILSIKKNSSIIIISILTFFVNMALILTKVGTDLAGYAGMDYSLGIFGYIYKMGGMLLFRFSIYFWGLVIIAILCLGYMFYKKKNLKDVIIRNHLLILIALGIICSQLILHVKSGMYGRYFLPTTLAVAILAVLVVFNIIKSHKKIVTCYEIMFGLAVCALLIIDVIPGALSSAGSRKDVRDCFQFLEDENAQKTIILVGLDAETNLATETYLEYKQGFKNVYSLEKEHIHNQINLENQGKIVQDIREATYIIGLEDSEYDGYSLIKDCNTLKIWKNKEL